MTVVVNDPDKVPLKICVCKLSQLKFLDVPFLEKLAFNPKLLLKRNNYYLVHTESAIKAQPDNKQITAYNLLTKTGHRLGYKEIMIVNDK